MAESNGESCSESSESLGSESAFPFSFDESKVSRFEYGLTKREWFAGKIAQGMLSDETKDGGYFSADGFTDRVIEFTDALLRRLDSSSRNQQEVSGSSAEFHVESAAPAGPVAANSDWRVGRRVKPKFRAHPLFNKAEGLIRAVHDSGFMGIPDVNGVLEIGLDWPFCFVVVQGANEWMTA